MRTSHYDHLVQLLRSWRAAPPLTEAAGQKNVVAVKYVEKAQRKADKRLSKADDDIEQLHRARKATKRARYAAELVKPADSQMKTIAREAENNQLCWASIKMPLSPRSSSLRSVLLETGRATTGSPTES